MPFQRVVCFKFKENSTSEEQQKHMDDFKGLKEKIIQIVSYAAGRTIPGNNGVIPEYDVMHYLTFNTEKDIAEYSDHEEHQKFIQSNKPIWEKVLVIGATVIE